MVGFQYDVRVLAAGHLLCPPTLSTPIYAVHIWRVAPEPSAPPFPSPLCRVAQEPSSPPFLPSMQSGPGTKRSAKVPSAIPIRELLASANDVASYWTMQRHHMPNHVMLRYRRDI